MKRRPCYLFTGILLIFICIICVETKVSRHHHTKAPNSSNSDSCETSPVRQNVTLRGGIRAGYFHKLSQYVAMELCVQLCCQEKGCDVAFMIGKNCYGVKCFSDELCHVVPARNAPRALVISKVDFRGEVYLQKFMPERLKCFQTSVEHNVTLKGGLQAGNFTAVGHVDNIDACAKLCCVSENCNLAMLVNNHCFMVKCHNKERCASIPVINQQFRTHIARVNRTRVIVKEQTVRALISTPGKSSKLMCKNGAVLHNQTLLGGYDAGTFKLLSHSTNMSACIRLCCGEMACDVAFMIERKCYGVVCRTLRLCQTIPAKSSVMLSHLSPKISYITSRNEEVNSIILRRQSEVCKSNVISYDVTLRGGKHAGKYKAFGPVDDMAECIRICCMEKFCDLAFMINGTCFTVRCYSEQSCREVKSPGSRFKPMISYVVRKKTGNHHKSQKKLEGKTLKHKEHQKGASKTSKKNSTSPELPHVPSPNLPSVDGEHYCTNSEIMYNVTLRGGITSGKFRDRGILPNMQECLRICCIATSCDLAFMLSGHCFSVTCKNQTLCEVVSARSTGYNPRVAYIYARSNTKNQESKLGKTSMHQKDHPKANSINKTSSRHNGKKKKTKHIKSDKISALKHKTHSNSKKKSKRKKKHKRKFRSSKEKLKYMYAKERILLRKLSLLKLRLEMMKRRKYSKDKDTKDDVLVEAFEDDRPNVTSISSPDSHTHSRSEVQNKTQKSNTTLATTKVVTKSSIPRKQNDDKETYSHKHIVKNITNNFTKPVTSNQKEIHDEKGAAHDKLSKEKQKLLQNDIFLQEKGKSWKDIGNKTGHFVHAKKSHGASNATSLLQFAKEDNLGKNMENSTSFELRKFRNNSTNGMDSDTQKFLQTHVDKQNNLQRNKKQNRTILKDKKNSSQRMRKLDRGKTNDQTRTASLEEMISQTTESNAHEEENKLAKNVNKLTYRTLGAKEKVNKHLGTSHSKTKLDVSVSNSQSGKVKEAFAVKKSWRTTKRNISYGGKKFMARSHDGSKQEDTTKDLMLLDVFSSGTEERTEQTPIDKYSYKSRNTSQTFSSFKRKH